MWSRPSTQTVNSLQSWWQAIRHMGLPVGLSWFFDSGAGKLVNFDIHMTPEKRREREGGVTDSGEAYVLTRS